MNSVEKANIIQQAICCSGNKAKEVADMFIQNHKCAEGEFQKLALLIFSIEALDCYRAPLVETTYAISSGTLVPTETITEYNNCLTEDEADAIADNITKLCDICDCENN